jgi:hypothetical protein
VATFFIKNPVCLLTKKEVGSILIGHLLRGCLRNSRKKMFLNNLKKDVDINIARCYNNQAVAREETILEGSRTMKTS